MSRTESPISTLDIGASAPDFSLPDQHGQPHRLKELRGRPVVLAFYCEDGTEGCATENREFSALAADFAAANAALFAISPQDVESHLRFAQKNKFAHPLLADPELKAIAPFGLWQQKKLWGREYMGVVRVTYIVDAKGKIAAIIPARKIKGHAQAVYDRLISLAAENAR